MIVLAWLIFILLVVDTAFLVAIAGSLVKLAANMSEPPPIPPRTAEEDRPRYWDGITPRKNWDGVTVEDE